MAENDIYNSKKQYETIVKKISTGVYLRPDKKTRYYIRNKVNLKYFKELVKEFEFKDISYIRRIQFMKALRKTCYFCDKDLKHIERSDVKEVLRKTNKIHNTINSRRVFVDYNKAIWKMILPEKDSQGREDDTIVPHAWRIKVHSDPSLRKDKPDKLTDTEYIKIQKSLNNDPRMQLYFSMLYVNLARPQELCYIDLDDIEIFDNYARVRISKHGKEGPKTLQLVDNYFYLVQWLDKHPLRKEKDKKIPLFITMGNNSRYERLSPKHTNKILRCKLKELGIDKPITNYSFKRNGVTIRYKAGEPSQNIQKIAGWTSTNQLKTYDLSEQEEFLEEELIKKGIIKPKDPQKRKYVTYKVCAFCNEINTLSNDNCSNCKRPLDREAILKAESEKADEIKKLESEISSIKNMLKEFIKSGKADELMDRIKH